MARRRHALVALLAAAGLLGAALVPAAAAPQSDGLMPRAAAVRAPVATPAATSKARNKQKLYVNPDTQAAAAASKARGGTRTALRYIAKTPQAFWVGDWYSGATTTKVVRTYTRAAKKKGQTPVVVVYAIPGRDCGQYSSGGFATPAQYRAWIRRVATGLKGTKALVVLEPDSLALECGDSTRDRLLAYAAKTLTKAGAWVYLDAGHSSWNSPATSAARLKRAGVAHARGFFTNVSNFRWTSKEKAYAKKVAAQLKKRGVGSTHRNYVIDVSRNGKGPTKDNRWCNPRGRGLGVKPRMVADKTGLDGLLWVKSPGESDGSCGEGFPEPGGFSVSLALELYRNRAR